MILSHEEWLRVPLFLEELKGLFSELSDQELEHLKKLAIKEEKRCSDRSVSNVNYNTGINVRG